MWDLIVSVPDHCLSFYFDCVHNMTFFNFAYAIYLILSPPSKTMLNRKYVIYLNKYKVLLSKNVSKQ